MCHPNTVEATEVTRGTSAQTVPTTQVVGTKRAAASHLQENCVTNASQSRKPETVDNHSGQIVTFYS